jgi:sRNA-binding protein
VFTKNALSAFFRRYTGSTSYLIAVSKAANRVDLDGQPAGELSAEHRQIALDELARRRGNQESRRELEEQQRRNRAGLLRDYETTTLTRANFCALKGVAVEELDGLLEIARGEAAERARMQPPAFDPRRPPQRPQERPPQGRPQQRPAQQHRSGPPSAGGPRPPRPPRPR